MYHQMPLELPQGVLELPQSRDPEFSIFVNKVRDHRDIQLEKQTQAMEAKEAELQSLKRRMNSLESALANINFKEAPVSRPVAMQNSIQTDDTMDKLTALSRQVAQLQSQLASRSVNAELDPQLLSESQFLGTRATTKSQGF
jgi:polyhydroxyalkanoate synthesis regulator phasin